MSPEFDKKLCESFPTLFKDRNGDPKNTCLCFGIETGDGWYDLIYELSKKISNIEKDIRVVQIKEKFGTLRYYISGCSSENFDEVYELIRMAEYNSATICEECGKSGKLRNDLGWIRTLCQDHYKEACKILKK